MKEQTRGFIWGMSLFTLLAACAVTKETTSEQPAPVPFMQIAKGALFGGGQEGFRDNRPELHIIRSEGEWENFKNQMNSVNNVTASFKDQDLDFSEEMVLGCVDMLRGSGGHEVRIKDVVESTERITVYVQFVSPGDMAASVLTQPFHIVRIPASDKSVIMESMEK